MRYTVNLKKLVEKERERNVIISGLVAQKSVI